MESKNSEDAYNATRGILSPIISNTNSLENWINIDDTSKKAKKDMNYYFKCALGGIISCGTTHTAIVPIDIAKCRIQVYPDKYRGLLSSLSLIIRTEGFQALKLGWFPTLIGYSTQGALKFGLYEYFKDYYSNIVGDRISSKYRGLLWLSASASAEFFADIALCPMEMVKVKVQTSPKDNWPTSLYSSTKNMWKYRLNTKFPYGSLVPLWSRQIPYTMAKFYLFESIVEYFYNNILTKPKDSYSKQSQLGVTFLSGYLSGIICAAVSHPADSIVSQLSQVNQNNKSITMIAKEMGLKNLFTKGLGTRIFMIGTLTGLQWWIYDSFKTMMGLETTGSNNNIKKNTF
ncbi:carrier protein [Cryptosporidium andersoni]|uniref:Carrier protein n=1 Tax=Cryptosporidium andersoni TaxID=117008 RepID=A0A1J4MPF3_9CRYT|nr:carrier protein [Cryptosporidium andersoni]